MRGLALVNWIWNDIVMPLVAAFGFALFLVSGDASWAAVAAAIALMSLNGAIRGAGQDQTSRIERSPRWVSPAHRPNPAQPRGRNRDADQYFAGYRAGRAGGGGGKKGCPLTALALLVLLPVLFVLSFFGRRQGEPEHGHHAGNRHRDSKPGDWTYSRPAEDEPDTPPPPRGGKPRNNLKE